MKGSEAQVGGQRKATDAGGKKAESALENGWLGTHGSEPGELASPSDLVDIPRLITAYYTVKPDPSLAEQRVSFGTSGHRGSSEKGTFNEAHILSVSQAVCDFRLQAGIKGPLFLGVDTHALSTPALISAIEVLGANGVELRLAPSGQFTPTPAISHAILTANMGLDLQTDSQRADGIVITPSHNPPGDGGFKYNPPHGGPAESKITSQIENRANTLLESGLKDVRRMDHRRALQLSTTQEFNFLHHYVSDLANVIDFEAIRGSGLSIGVDPLGGAGVHYWQYIAQVYKLSGQLTVVSERVDPTFSFMTLDWDRQIRMDPSSPYAMKRLIAQKDHFDIAFACDTDHDRHGIVTKQAGLLKPNDYLSLMTEYLFTHRPQWSKKAQVGKTMVSSQMINRVARSLGRDVYEVPVGFKFFVEGLHSGHLGLAGEESAGASFLRRDGSVWTTDKDGLIAGLLSAEITAVLGKDLAAPLEEQRARFGVPFYDRREVACSLEQKAILTKISAEQVRSKELAGEEILQVLTRAPDGTKGNNQALDGVKVETKNGWFAARPSGTENIYKIYAESFLGQAHLETIFDQASDVVDRALAAGK